MAGICLQVKKSPGENEIFVSGDGAVLTAPEGVGEIERVINVLAKLQPLAVKEYIGLRITLDNEARKIVEVEPESMRLEVERVFRS